MEEETMVSTMNKTAASDSSIVNLAIPQYICPSNYKGVIHMKNGRWGVQIYAKKKRIWLGTFKTEVAAALAYDSAAMLLRNGNSNEAYRNFTHTHLTMYEPQFQAQYTTDQVLRMINDGSYHTKFGEYVYSIFHESKTLTSNYNINQKQQDGYMCEELFRKELTQSDVGKLNRLVLPKRYALKYFPIKDKNGRKLGVYDFKQGDDQREDRELIFYDKELNRWRFRYCYWKSSQSFVLTSGWNSFVRVKELEAGDIVTFFMCEVSSNDAENVTRFLMIDIIKCNAVDTKKGEAVETERVNNKGFRLFGVEVVPTECDQ